MRSSDLKHLAALEADELASDAFDAYGPAIEAWTRDAFVGEWDKNSEDAAREIVRTAVLLATTRYDTEQHRVAVTKVRAAANWLRECYVEHASVNGLYAAQGYDYACAAREEADEAQREAHELDRQIEADEAASIRQADALQAELRG